MQYWLVLTDRLPPHLDIDPLLTENEVAAWLRMSLRTLTRKRKAGLIHGIPWNARRYRYTKSEIERFIRAAEQGAVVYFGTRDKEAGQGSKEVSPIEGAGDKAPAPKHYGRRGKAARSRAKKESNG
jgi:hypothetical protein